MQLPAGLHILHHAHETRLKWHRLRCKIGDPLFSPDVMAEGFRVGASMELDLRVRADGGFAVLHDDVLEGETTGKGLVCITNGPDLAALSMLDGGKPVMSSENLAGMIAAAHPQALLQFDMKDELPLIGSKGIDHLRDYFTDALDRIIVSGHDLDLIVALKQAMPDLKRGIDPTDKLVDISKAQGWTAVERDLLADLTGPTEPDTIYLEWRLLLAAARQGLDLVALCHDHNKLVDAWTYNLQDKENGFSHKEWGEFAALMDLKPDQITTDFAPATEAAWLKRMA